MGIMIVVLEGVSKFTGSVKRGFHAWLYIVNFGDGGVAVFFKI